MTKELWHDKNGYNTIYITADELTDDMKKELHPYEVGWYEKAGKPYAHQFSLSKQQLKRCKITHQKIKNFKVIS